MLDIAWSEIILVGTVALVAVGPKDLPKAMLALGRLARQARQFGNEIRQQFDQLTSEAEAAARQDQAVKPGEAAPPDQGSNSGSPP